MLTHKRYWCHIVIVAVSLCFTSGCGTDSTQSGNPTSPSSTTPDKPNTNLQPSAPTTISNARISVTPKTIKPRDKFTLTASFELSTKANIGTASIKAVRKVNVNNETGDILDLGSHSISSDDKAYSFDLHLDSPSTGVAATRTELATDIVKRYFDVQVWVQLNGQDTMVGQDQLIVATEEENPN